MTGMHADRQYRTKQSIQVARCDAWPPDPLIVSLHMSLPYIAGIKILIIMAILMQSIHMTLFIHVGQRAALHHSYRAAVRGY